MYVTFVAAVCLTLVISAPAPAAQPQSQPVNCLECHGDLEKGKSVHAAVSMGCESCHTAIDASDIPHVKKNKIAKGLSATQPDLCFGCHDKAVFEKKVVHAAVSMGCTGCHNPHASDAASLLLSPVGKLCVTCHDKQASGRHIMASFALGDDHPVKGPVNPAKPDKDLSCVSCHNPHSSNQSRLLVQDPTAAQKKIFLSKIVISTPSSQPKQFGEDLFDPSRICLMCHRKISVTTDKP